MGVAQLSLPYRIALVALLVVGGLWFAVLRPKSADTPTPTPATAPGATGLGNAVDKAKGAVDASNAAADKTTDAVDAVGGAGTATGTPGTAATPSTTAAAKPARPGLADDAVAGDPSKPVLAAVDSGKVAVLLFWNKKASDDRATRDALSAIDRHKGEVVTRAIPIGQVGKYEAITRGAQVLESPTVLVIGAGGKARSIVGYTQASEIDELVGVVGGKGFQAKKAFHLTGFAKTADDVCRDSIFAIQQSSDFPTTRDKLVTYLETGATAMGKARTRLQAAPAKTAADRKLKTALVAFATKDIALAKVAATDVKDGGNAAEAVTTLISAETAAHAPAAAAAKTARVRGCQ